MKRKLLKIDKYVTDCSDCVYWQIASPYWCALAEQTIELDYTKEFPAWCPLPEKKEKTTTCKSDADWQAFRDEEEE